MEVAFFQIGPLSVYRFGFTLGLAYLVGALVGRRFALRTGFSRQGWWWLVLSLMAASLAGARIADILPDLPYYLAHPGEIWRLPIEGLSFYGGVAGALLVLAVTAKRRGKDFWTLADLLALPYLAGAVVASVVWGAPIPPIPGPVNLGMDAAHLTGVYALTWWTWLKQKEQSFSGESALFVLAGDGVLRLLLTAIALPYFEGGIASAWPILTLRFGATLLAVVLFVVRGAGSRLLVPIVDPFQSPLSRWFGWFVAYGFLLALAAAVRV